MAETILLIGTLDTKGAEFAYVRDLITERGHKTVVMDTGVGGEPSFTPDISATEVAEAGHKSLTALREAGDRGESLTVMSEGAEFWLSKPMPTVRSMGC